MGLVFRGSVTAAGGGVTLLWLDGRVSLPDWSDIAKVAVGVTVLVLGAALAVLGGLLQHHFLYRRRRRVAARPVYADFLDHLRTVHFAELQSADDTEPRIRSRRDDLKFDPSAWKDNEATLAETRSVDTFEAVREAYEAMDTYARAEPRSVMLGVHAEQEERWREVVAENPEFADDDDGDDPLTDDDIATGSREYYADETIEALKRAAMIVGAWGGYRKADVETAVADTDYSELLADEEPDEA